MKKNRMRILGFFSILFFLITTFAILLSLRDTQNELLKFNEIRYKSYITADELRQSSDDLTKLTRLYVITKLTDEDQALEYLREYRAILDIRNGKIPRPEKYSQIFWDFAAINHKNPTPNSKTTKSLKEIMTDLKFSDAEFALLEESNNNSDKLVNTEVIAMNLVNGKIGKVEKAVIKTGESPYLAAIRIMHDRNYMQYKVDIMKPINLFFDKLDERTNNMVLISKKKVNFLIILGILIPIFLLLMISFGWSYSLRVQIKNKTKELRDLNHELEDIVDKRTETLQKTNLYLEQTMAELQESHSDLEEMNSELEISLEELKETQNQLIVSESLAALGELVAGITHDINTPLGIGVTLGSHILDQNVKIKNKFNNNELTKHHFLEYLNDSHEELVILNSNLEKSSTLIASFKQVAADQTSNEVRAFNISDCLEDIIKSLKPKFKNTQYTVEVKCNKEIEARSCPGAINQIVTNFIINSLKHGFAGKEQGMISIRVEKENEQIVFTYEDDGNGIPEENLNKVFNPFFSTGKQTGSTGLGLHIVYNLVTTSLKGSIQLKSELGHGVLFKINFSDQ